METKTLKLMKKIALTANTCLIGCVIGLFLVYYHFNIDIMVSISIPIFCVYLIYYGVILYNRLNYYFWFVYATLAIYMCSATLCLGVGYGFNLYCMSLIPIGFFCQYLAFKLKSKSFSTGYASLILIVLYFASIIVVFNRGPLYVLDKKAEMIFYVMNSFFVCMFLVMYSWILVKLVIDSEKKLEHIAMHDKLTGLYNRHSTRNRLAALEEQKAINWISIVDIDKFKSINDVYGHTAGDAVLQAVSNIMTETCTDCHIARWGGEEFLIFPLNFFVKEDILETLRQKIEEADITFEDMKIKVTVSAGGAYYSESSNVETCIKTADKRLYYSKENGRNRITWNRD